MAAPASSKREVPLNIFRPNKPFEATCISNELIVGKDAPGETWHMIFNTDGMDTYLFCYGSFHPSDRCLTLY
jgi:ferredoxin--NADP+ reductase